MERVIATTTVAAALALTLFSGITAAQWIAAGIVVIGVPLFYRSVTRRAEAKAKLLFWEEAEAIIASSAERPQEERPFAQD